MVRLQSMVCDDEARRARVAGHDSLHGIDYIEVVSARRHEEPEKPQDEKQRNQRVLRVYFIPKRTEPGQQSLKSLLDALDGKPAQVSIEGGGARRDRIQPTTVKRKPDDKPNHLEVTVSEPGDFSTYALRIESAALDPAYAERTFSFAVDCPGELDFLARERCPVAAREPPLIDYLAKDYASFRQALLDLVAREVPGWRERHAADLGMALVELLAYAGDQLSYYQDAVANEAYLETARQRVSVRRHARLVDYRMHDGVSARTFVHFEANTPGTVPAATALFTRINRALGATPPGKLIAPELVPAASELADATFETAAEAHVHSRLNRIAIYTWGNGQCCLPMGATTLDLVGNLGVVNEAQNEAWRLKPGDFLLLEEVKGPGTGNPADADPGHRQVVRLTRVAEATDPLEAIALTRVSWDWADRLTFPLCLSARVGDEAVDGVSVARGNLVLADHGHRISAEYHPGDPGDPRATPMEPGPRAYRFRLNEGPLSFRAPLPSTTVPAKALMAMDPHAAEPQVVELRSGPGDVNQWSELWEPVAPHLLDSGPFHRHVVVETENDGRALLRFGDGQHGMAPTEGSFFKVTYRVGIGSAGNIGADALYHVARPMEGRDWPSIGAVRNPLRGWGGIEPERLAQVKQLAPAACHAKPLRAVTEQDYARVAAAHPEVQQAVATFRWTGSWYTVFLTVDPVGAFDLPPELVGRVRGWVQRYTQAGYDLEIAPPVYVPLDIAATVCVAPGHFRAHVLDALLSALGNGVLPDGTRGFFHPDHFTFAEPLYLSRLYSAMAGVPGVDSVEVTQFKRLGRRFPNERGRGYIRAGRLEVLRLDNDPSFPERGMLRLNMRGGK